MQMKHQLWQLVFYERIKLPWPHSPAAQSPGGAT